MVWAKLGFKAALVAGVCGLGMIASSALAQEPLGQSGWSRYNSGAESAAQGGKPVVIEVLVPLCSDKRGGPCGKHEGAGDATDLEHNIYWGAVFGARRWFERPWLGWQRTEQAPGSGNVLERVTYKRSVAGKRWGSGAPVEVIVVLQAINGDMNEEAMDEFRNKAISGGSVKFNDGSGVVESPIHAIGFMGRNPLLKNGKPPAEKDLDLPEPSKSSSAIPSFSIAAHSRETLGAWLYESGSPALVLSRGATASEGYLLEAVVRGLAENDAGWVIRKRATEAYAKQHKMTKSTAEIFFSPNIPQRFLK